MTRSIFLKGAMVRRFVWVELSGTAGSPPVFLQMNLGREVEADVDGVVVVVVVVVVVEVDVAGGGGRVVVVIVITGFFGLFLTSEVIAFQTFFVFGLIVE